MDFRILKYKRVEFTDCAEKYPRNQRDPREEIFNVK